ncbi:hypothetical protein FisN_2Lh346 [Fistulifera solaris]|uniref:Uncharacterized protein n=1 Tax=Fistulifera solaris TaxID=1519565 RepID=A0A1Z5J7V8_FISSO|nr:hypothetical protein FisN_2Lh346 [Fistulifera solaris]|eukprot:GAX10077.1 hypothetical protein FisN_2Lh346 [Fistulifera solaris]
MLFRQAFRTLSRTFGRRRKSTATFGDEGASSSGNGALVAAVGTTFVTYMTADFLSNFIQHPTQQMDYGYFNQFIGRPVTRNWWGTRTEHIVGVAACLAVTDHASQAYFSKFWLGGRALSFAAAPATFVAHTFFFIFTGVTLYVGVDAAFNPQHAGKRTEEFLSGTYSSAVGSCTAWYEPYVSPALARIAGPAFAGGWFGSSLLPATLAYSTVKGCGWNDWGNNGLNDLELSLNGLTGDKE